MLLKARYANREIVMMERQKGTIPRDIFADQVDWYIIDVPLRISFSVLISYSMFLFSCML
jgi:hypothetical protein